jgi:nucleotide-binding universal stress UspA family protein
VASSVLVATAEGSKRRNVWSWPSTAARVRARPGAPGTAPSGGGIARAGGHGGPDTTLARQQLQEAQLALQAAGVVAETELAAGEPQQVLPELVARHAPALLVMGAFGHSRLRCVRQAVAAAMSRAARPELKAPRLLRLSDVVPYYVIF